MRLLATSLAIALFALAPAAPAGAAEPPGMNDFAFDLYRELAKGETGNLFFSPFSVATALAMTASGAKGETLAAMERTLRAKATGPALHAAYGALVADLNAKGKAGRFELSVANRLFGQKGKAFLPGFLDLLDQTYGALIHPLDFAADPEAARVYINRWVEEVTKARIKDLVPPGAISGVTRLVLVNAIYFKGKWAAEFDRAATKDEPFATADGAKVPVLLMHREAECACAEVDGAKAVELPYKNDELSMIAILPPEGKPLAAWAADLTWERLKPLVDALARRETILALPRFRMEWSGLLKGTLSALGMGLACSEKADFSGMDGERWLYVGEVVHKAFVETNEEGTEAAAATAVMMDGRGMPEEAPPPPFVFRADRPFLFLIRDNASGAILFLGRVMKP